ncbi:hypothetical protein Ahy_B06g083531 [Arachis hypogaea]|uniref:FKBP12-interacting protein of 37 kDa n=1 Tax=Arachis hypogaea TaxID=3818 RepID=A0A444YPZ5_ARAHY|nr:hypothetical protein Ahy_B06g083531 [Arachis hypogaea]
MTATATVMRDRDEAELQPPIAVESVHQELVSAMEELVSLLQVVFVVYYRYCLPMSFTMLPFLFHTALYSDNDRISCAKLVLIQLHIAILTISLSIVTINISLCLTLLFPFILSNLVIDSLQNCKDTLATCQNEVEAAKSEIQSWHYSIQNEPCVPAGATPEPKMLLDYLQALKSSEESLREQLEKVMKKEAAFIVTFAKREQEIAELKVSCSK